MKTKLGLSVKFLEKRLLDAKTFTLLMAQEIDPTAEDKMRLNVLKTLIPHPFFFIFSPGQRATMALTKLLQML